LTKQFEVVIIATYNKTSEDRKCFKRKHKCVLAEEKYGFVFITL